MRSFRKVAKAVMGLVCGSALCVGGFCGAAHAEKKYSIKWAEYSLETDIKFKSINQYAKRVGELTNHQVEFKMYPGQSLAKTQEMFDALMQGRIDMALLSIPYYVGKMPALELYSAPLLLASRPGEICHVVASGKHTEVLDKEFSRYRMKYLNWGAEAPNGLLVMRDKLAKQPADITNLKIRAPGMQAKIVDEWGAKGVAIPQPEVYMSIQRGIVDGLYFSISSTKAQHLWEVASFMTDTNVPMGSMLAVCNLNLWNSFSKEIKAAFNTASKEMAEFTTAVQAQDTLEMREYLKGKFKGTFVLEPNSAEFKKFWRPVEESLIPKILSGMDTRFVDWHNLILDAQKNVWAAKKW